jgi:D-alanyl-lipoteichoic acid acyltransferase DltB (MBOAT superfamily)
MELIVSLLRQQNEALFLFTNLAFWMFFGGVLLGHAIVYKYKTWRVTFLFVVSLFFYYKTGGYFFSLLIISTISDYFIGLGLGKMTTNSARRFLLVLSLCINLGLLAYFKYLFFFVDLLNEHLHTTILPVDYLAQMSNKLFRSSFSIENITLPVGISFFTFQTLSYSIDVYRRKIPPVKSILDFGFYVSFFPQLIAGPIVRASQFIPQLSKPFYLSQRAIWQGILLILAGLTKKMVISDYLSVNLIDRVFENPVSYSGFEILTAVYGYALQIYCDFSGYTDIAIGIALLLGFRLPQNFNSPYKALSITDFWRRWHISLSLWLKDYLYIPLGGNKKGSIRTGINLLITMLLGGLWHGANTRFVLWGLMHGVGLLVDKLFTRFSQKLTFRLPKALTWLLTFHFVGLSWILFRAPSMETIHIMLHRLVNAFQPQLIYSVILAQPIIFLYLFIGFFIHWLPASVKSYIKRQFLSSPILIRIVLSAGVLYLIYNLHMAELQPFIYFRF